MQIEKKKHKKDSTGLNEQFYLVRSCAIKNWATMQCIVSSMNIIVKSKVVDTLEWRIFHHFGASRKDNYQRNFT